MDKDNGSQTRKRVLFFGRSNCDASAQLLAQLTQYDFDVKSVLSSRRGEKIPEFVRDWQGDYIICFRSFFILRKDVIESASVAAINFHPAPPEYPGSGCINFALYDQSSTYGVTAHLMDEKVDSGAILEVRRFPVDSRDTLKTVLDRTHAELQFLCADFIRLIAQCGAVAISRKVAEAKNESWNGEARRLKELDDLQTIDPNISKSELERIIRATYIEGFPPWIDVHGFKFYLKLDR